MSNSGRSNGIAVVGMSGRFPAASGVQEFWKNLVSGQECFREFSVDALVARGLPRHVAETPEFVRRCPIVDHPSAFDSSAFGYDADGAAEIEPQHRMLLQCTRQALENARHDPQRLDGVMGAWVGCGVAEYPLKHLLATFGPFSGLTLGDVTPRNEGETLCSRLARHFDLRGPVVQVQTACSTSLVAVHLACEALMTYQCDLAVAGGVALQYSRIPGYLYVEGGIFSPDGYCRAFDRRANGTVFGEGCGVVVLRRLEEALAGGDTVLAVIRGSAVNNDGAARAGYTAPGVAGQARLITQALSVAGVEPEQLGYVETHGTGTALGDPIEVTALTQAFRAGTHLNGYCGLGSAKPTVGHLDAAAGVTGLIKTVCALRHRQLPATRNYSEANAELNLDSSPFFVVQRTMDWRPIKGQRLAGVSSFGLGGTNAHVVLQESADDVHRTPSP